MSTASPATPILTRIFGRNTSTPCGPVADLNVLLKGIEHRLYQETVPVLASWWLKTVYYAGHNRAWWEELDAAIGSALRNPLGATATDALADIQKWLRAAILARHKAPDIQSRLAPPFRTDLTRNQAAPYVCRLLNEWLPGEVARQLTDETEFTGSSEAGMPALTVATALERLLLREHFSPASLELLLESASLAPKYLYPVDLEILRDVVLSFLGRIDAPSTPVLSPTPLAGGFADALERAYLVAAGDEDELHAPLDESRASDVFRHDPLRLGSIVVTADGRWWEAARIQSGPETVIVYRPGGLLRIDFSSDHARIVAPWPAADTHGDGAVQLPERIELFGRQWHGRSWEKNADRTWLHLEFSRVLALPETLDPEQPRPQRLRSASREMAWSEVERALAAGAPGLIDQLHREDLIPLGHALARLVDYIVRPWPRSSDVERGLMAVRYLHGIVASSYGPIPWRVLPAPARTALLKRRDDPALTEYFAETFDEPPAARTPPRAA